MKKNPEKNTAFHLRNIEATGSLKVVWNETELENTAYPVYLGVTLDESLSYKHHIQNTKMQVATRNNLLAKLATSKWGVERQKNQPERPTLCLVIFQLPNG